MIRPRARHLRIAVQAAFLLGFVSLFWGLAEPRVPASVASILLALDPRRTLAAGLCLDLARAGGARPDCRVGPLLLWLDLSARHTTARGVMDCRTGAAKAPKDQPLPPMVLYQVHHPHGASHVGGTRNESHRLARSHPAAAPGVRFRNPTLVARWPLTSRLGVLRSSRGHPPSFCVDAPVLLPRCLPTWCTHGCLRAARSTQNPPR